MKITMSAFWRRLFQFPVAMIMAVYYLLTAIVGPIAKPIVRALARLRIVAALRDAIERLGPYPSFVLLVVPVIIIEPLKIGALAILGSGRIVLGTIALVVSHGLSLIIIERLFATVRPKLLTLPWFAALWFRFTALRDRLLAWLHATWAWSVVLRVRDTARESVKWFLCAIGLSRKT